MRPRLLDLFSGAGGAAVGYHQAGFEVVGVDINPQPRYPFEHHVADAMTFPLDGFDAIHASPPCHDHSALASLTGSDGTAWMLPAIRERLRETGLPYVIENVPGAPLIGPVWLCGSEFGLAAAGRNLKRHRGFESNVFLIGAGGCWCHGRPIGGVYGHGGGAQRDGRRGWQFSAEHARQALDIAWMNRDELSQAIPPAYTSFIGEQLMAALPAPAMEGTHR